jgi:hypothetical protein
VQRASTAFLGSSSEGRDVAVRLAALLDDYGIESSVWSQGVFDVGEHVLDGLVRKAKTVDFAILVLSPDDDVESRSARSQAPRDNVIFELGLFIGALGKDRTYMVHPDGVSLKLPSDLAGITQARYRTRADNDVSAALSAVAVQLSDRIRKLGPRDAAPDVRAKVSSKTALDRDIHRDLGLLRGNLAPQGWTFKWNQARSTLRVKGPRGNQHTLKMGRPAEMQADFDRFLRELRSRGARFDANLRQSNVG